ncbi:MAG: hypothetical protein WBL74_07900 [Novosphingobium sp.]|uniref:hypothetical protein n=1 Tax=Novosphingobium sp. TaxID=1874826 RepID=UPI003C7A3D1D
MTEPAARLNPTWGDRLRGRLGERAIALILSLAIEAVLILAILSLGQMTSEQRHPAGGSLVSVSFEPDKVDRPTAKPVAAAAASRATPQQAARAPAEAPSSAAVVPHPVVTPSTAPRPFMELAGGLDISKLPRQSGPAGPAKKMFGPPGSGASAGDSKRVGTAPNGQPMYAAAWYREPYPDELAGYLSTADGPGWALIACRTAPDWRVEDCVALDEYPNGSNMARAVLAASWQFQVRPPQIGGVYKVGEWVRIRIDYSLRRGR